MNRNDKHIFDKFIRYSSLAFEMAAMIGLGTWGGIKLDEHFEMQTPVFTASLAVFCVLGSLYLVVKQLKNDK